MSIRRSASILSGLLLVSAFALGACGSSSATGAPGGSPNPSSKPTTGDLPAAGGGSCSVSITGDVSASWQDEQSVSSVLLSYWLGPAEREMLGMTEGEESFLFNCQGSQGQLSMYSAGDTTSAQFPKAPGTYVIAASGILGGGASGQVSLLLTLGDDTLLRVSEPGTLNITALDGSKFAGTFQAKIAKLSPDDLKTVVATGTLSGSFDFGCKGLSCG